MYRTVWALGLAALLTPAAVAAGAPGREAPGLAAALALQDAQADAIKRAEPSIACILVSRSDDPRGRSLDDPDQVPESYGSGVVIDKDGLILTNLHVVRDATAIYVRLPGNKAAYATVYAGDPRSDLAVLRLGEAPGLRPLPALRFGDSSRLRKGDFVLSLAHPFAAGFRDGSPSASWGIISNVRRRAPLKPATDEASYSRVLHQYGTLLQTDARLNLGCSGGALLDLRGDLVGLTTSLAGIYGGETPGGFAVPIDAGMRRIIDVLRRGEEVEYGFLGISFLPKHRLPPGDGVPIGEVIRNSPAYNAGLRGAMQGQGQPDYIRSVNGVRVHDSDDLFLALGTLMAGSYAQLEVAHTPHGPAEVKDVRLAKFYVPGKIIAARRPEPVGGLRVDWTSILYLRPGGQQIYARGIPPGVMIREVLSGSAADIARLQESKVIQKVNDHPVTTPEEFYREMRKAVGSAELTLWSSDLKVRIDLR
jgi:S1-C subfamily serine protease